ncbi:hypothetical protein PsYK624_157900 [Phanerochaete sordida]|uniref:Uncharacterized protein n=1 Tax=Phanerochaete sordida TaxID=48140 RepID=A0A9P3GSG3_9APHY|nr:hypothetical protein PsYK624_157900 [Phanerochaete sordida]
MNGVAKSNPSSTATNSLDGGIALLTQLLAQSAGGEDGDVEGPELQALLRRLEAADGVARGVEDRLDDIIGNLDQILGGLEAEGEQPPAQGKDSHEEVTTEGGHEEEKPDAEKEKTKT